MPHLLKSVKVFFFNLYAVPPILSSVILPMQRQCKRKLHEIYNEATRPKPKTLIFNCHSVFLCSSLLLLLPLPRPSTPPTPPSIGTECIVCITPMSINLEQIDGQVAVTYVCLSAGESLVLLINVRV